MSEGLIQRWRALAGPHADALGRALIEAWAEPQRKYHDQTHLLWLLNEGDKRASLIADPLLLGYAIWFHDAVYRPGEGDNESLSAQWAKTALSAAPQLAERVARLVEMTKHHALGEASSDEALFLDMDIAILGAPEATYRRYAADIRAEYPHVPDPAFAAGRSAFLHQELGLARTFRTDLYEGELGESARANMRWELQELREGRMVRG